MKILHPTLVEKDMPIRTSMSNELHSTETATITSEYYDIVSKYDHSDVKKFMRPDDHLVVVNVDDQKILYIYGEDGAYVDEGDVELKYCPKCFDKIIIREHSINQHCQNCDDYSRSDKLLDENKIKMFSKEMLDTIEDLRHQRSYISNSLNGQIETLLDEKIEYTKEKHELERMKKSYGFMVNGFFDEGLKRIEQLILGRCREFMSSKNIMDAKKTVIRKSDNSIFLYMGDIKEMNSDNEWVLLVQNNQPSIVKKDIFDEEFEVCDDKTFGMED